MKSLALFAAFLLAAGANAAEMKILDFSAGLKADQLMKQVSMKAVKIDQKAYFTDFYLEFVTKGEWVAGGAGFNKEVSAVLGAVLVGVPDEKFQEITDEAFAYAQQKFGESYTMVPDDKAQEILLSFEKIKESPSSVKQEQLRVETPYLGVFASKKFAPGNKVRPAPSGASGMAAYKAWYNAALKLEATNISYTNKVEFARVGSSIGSSNQGKTASVSINPQLFMVGGGAGFGSTKMKNGMLQPKDFAGFPDTGWVKETRKNEKGVYEVVVDPELYKAAALKLVKAHIDAMADVVKENKK